MATYKRVVGDYNITTVNSTDNVNITTHTVVINGNLDVAGNLTYIDVSELSIADPFIMLNVSNTPADPNSYSSYSGVLTHKTSNAYAGIRYNDVNQAWEISIDTTDANGVQGTWEQLATANSAVLAAGSNTQVQFNDSGVFGASSKFVFDKSTSLLGLEGSLKLSNTSSLPTATANSVSLFYGEESGGGTSIYFVSPTAEDELISRSKAIVFSLIF